MINIPHLKPLTIRELRNLNLEKSIYKIIYYNNKYIIIDVYKKGLKIMNGLFFYDKKHAKLTLQKLTVLGINKKSVQLKLDI